jgi:ubiquinone/menaquinone biosynthesis C-methylase UbiE
MSEQTPIRARDAFRFDAAAHRAAASAKAVWWTVNGWTARRLTPPHKQETPVSTAPPPPQGFVRQAWREAFAKDAADVAAGLYRVEEAPPSAPLEPFLRALDVIADARAVQARRAEGRATEAREHADSPAYPVYYRQNFHYQSGGWFTPESARRYEAQVEALFSGAAGPMRRRALSLLAKAWRARDQRELTLVDLACGSGAFLVDLKATFPRAAIAGVDLSPAYLDEARARSGAAVVQALAERLPFADASLDGIACIYLFHELPPKIRPQVAAEIARVLKPGGVLAFADSVQASDTPELARLLDAFPAFFHEPYYTSYQTTDLKALFEGAGLTLKGADSAFLTKALLFEKAG